MSSGASFVQVIDRFPELLRARSRGDDAQRGDDIMGGGGTLTEQLSVGGHHRAAMLVIMGKPLRIITMSVRRLLMEARKQAINKRDYWPCLILGSG